MLLILQEIFPHMPANMVNYSIHDIEMGALTNSDYIGFQLCQLLLIWRFMRIKVGTGGQFG
jgi:hypothetical protein